MKKIKVLFAIIFILLFASCGKPREVDFEDTEEKDGITYVKGESKGFTGIVKKSYDNGKLAYESNYKDGKLYKNGELFSGIEEKYDEDNRLSARIPYINGEINGVAIYYFRGALFQEIPYVNGKRQGISKLYSSDNGMISSETPYVNDEINGTVKDYDKNGELYSETSYVNGKKQGLEKIYTDGKLVEKKPYVNGELSGIGEKNGKRNIYINDEEKREKIIKYAEKKLSYYLKDPTSYERIIAYISGDKVYIRYRAKNSFGAYDIDEIDIPIEEYWIE